MHGLTGSPEVFHSLETVLSEKNIQVLTPCLPGHKTTIEDLRNRKWHEWFGKIEQAYHILVSQCENVFVIGLSMGGTLSLLLASQYPVKGVVSIAAPIQFRFWLRYLIPIARVMIPDWKKDWNHFEQNGNHVNTYDRYPLNSVLELIKLCNVTKSALKSLNCPVLILHGKGDKRVSNKNAKMIYKKTASKRKNMITYPVNEHVLINCPDASSIFNDIVRFVCEND